MSKIKLFKIVTVLNYRVNILMINKKIFLTKVQFNVKKKYKILDNLIYLKIKKIKLILIILHQ